MVVAVDQVDRLLVALLPFPVETFGKILVFLVEVGAPRQTGQRTARGPTRDHPGIVPRSSLPGVVKSQTSARCRPLEMSRIKGTR